jgi:cation diffusion facilitator CzcD-associated flavoprotein CzcO
MSDSKGSSALSEVDVDADALHRKYLEERGKRLHPERAQYVDVTGAFAHYVDDPHVEPGFSRQPLTDEVDVIVVGGGFSGLLASARLRQAGIEKIRIIDKAGDFGGTWYWNRYPGASCDVESYIYMPLLEEIGYIPSERYAKAPEILEHSRAIGRHFDLYRNACFQTQITELQWDDAAGRWIVRTDRGDMMRARFVCAGNGPLNRPKLPGIPGIETFRGHSFHTSRWDYRYTGGNSLSGLTGLQDKHVAIIGTGATAIQCIPHLGEWAKQLYVIQRTPSSVAVRDNRPTDFGWAKALKRGWQKQRMRNFESCVLGIPQAEDLVQDGWTSIGHALALDADQRKDASPADLERLVQIADYNKMEQIRQRVDAIVKNRDTAESLKPYYNVFCKRPCFHDEYLQTFNRANVELIDTQGKGIDRVTPQGFVFKDQQYELDCLIYATGFDVAAPVYRGGGFTIRGRRGVSLADKWAGGVRSLHGMCTHGFPNLFIVAGLVQASVTFNQPFLIEEQCVHFARIVQHCLSKGITTIEATQQAEDRWVATIKAKSVTNAKFTRECTPGFYNNEGKDGGTSIFANFYGGGPFEYIEILGFC